MAAQTFDYTTGPAALADDPRNPSIVSASLSYNGCIFSPLYVTTLTGSAVKDKAQRTVIYMEYMLTADGYVTLPSGSITIAPTMYNLQRLLTAQGGRLIYMGRGFDLVINASHSVAGPEGNFAVSSDVAWGPVPELLEFQPLGGGLSAKVKWQCKVRIFAQPINGRLIQFNYETKTTYGEDGFSSLNVKGTMEIPMTRSTQNDRKITTTVDNLRYQLDSRVFAGIDLSRFRITRRDYDVSRDKRTMEFNVAAEEKPYMDLPRACNLARGTFNVRPARSGMGLVLWLCTLRATYTVAMNFPRREAWYNFLELLRLRMLQAEKGNIVGIQDRGAQNPGRLGVVSTVISTLPTVTAAALGIDGGIDAQRRDVRNARRAFLLDFSIDEGLYLDSKTVSFSATWRLVTTMSHILIASGLWQKTPEVHAGGPNRNRNRWAVSMRLPSPGADTGILGNQSWLPNRLDPKLDFIVDLGE